MPLLFTNLNQLSQDPQTQLAQVQQMGNDIINWSNSLPSQLLVDYTEPIQSANETTSNIVYKPFANFTTAFTPNNPLCSVTFHLFLQGQGFVGVFFNGQLSQEIYFLNPSVNTLAFSKAFTLSGQKSKISLQWRASSASTTCTKINSQSQPGLNNLQVKSENS